MNEKFRVIYADPPWPFSSRQLCGRAGYISIESHYKVMSIADIEALDVGGLALDDAALFMWTTNAHLTFALGVIKAWGFEYRTIAFVWVKRLESGKPKSNMGPWTMGGCEMCLLGIRGRMTQYKRSNNVKQLLEATVTRHSSKPFETRLRIERLFGDVPRVELFARTKPPGWSVWGNEVNSDIILEERR